MPSLFLALRPLCYTRVECIAEWLSKQIWPSSLPPIWCHPPRDHPLLHSSHKNKNRLSEQGRTCLVARCQRIHLARAPAGLAHYFPRWQFVPPPPPLPPNSPILTCVHGGLTLVLLVLFPEAFAPAILLKEAQRLRSRGGETGANALAPLELKDCPLRTALSSIAGSATARSDPICVYLAATVVGRASLANGVPAD